MFLKPEWTETDDKKYLLEKIRTNESITKKKMKNRSISNYLSFFAT